jgi:amino acid permease
MEAILYQGNNMTKVLSLVGLAALAALAAWQFYAFATFKDTAGAVDVQGGSLHLWLAIGLAIVVCVGGFFLFSKFLRYDKQNEMHITSTTQSSGPTGFRKDVL